jgi:rhodanese-related sulfurtransferase
MNEVGIAELRNIFKQNIEGVIIVDVRDCEERIQGFIPSSIHIPLEILVSRISHFLTEFEGKNVYFQCLSGRRSKKATTVFLQAGFKNVFSVAGGLKAWEKAGFEVLVE